MVTQRKHTFVCGFDSLDARNFIALVRCYVRPANDNNPNYPVYEG